MKAARYEQFGPAAEVLTVGDLEDPQPGPGEVLVRLHASAVNPSDVKNAKRQQPPKQREAFTLRSAAWTILR